MAFKKHTTPGPDGQTSLSIQQHLTYLRRRLAASDAAALILATERQALQAEIEAQEQRYLDTVHAGAIARRGAAAVWLAEEILCSDIPY